MGEIFLEWFGLGTAILSGFLSYRKLPLFFRGLFFETLFYFAIIELPLRFIVGNNESVNQKINLVHLLEESIVLLLVVRFLPWKNPVNRGIPLLVIPFICISFLLILFLTEENLSQIIYFAVLENFILLMVYLYIIHQQLRGNIFHSHSLPVVLASLGLVLFCAGSIPLLSIILKVIKSDLELAESLYKFIVVVLANIRYLLIAVSFLLIGLKRRSV